MNSVKNMQFIMADEFRFPIDKEAGKVKILKVF